ncbi:MAG: hypothetical protein ACYSWQ_14310 [Planctomycetota bacterium]|jgi:hypothetical protein
MKASRLKVGCILLSLLVGLVFALSGCKEEAAPKPDPNAAQTSTPDPNAK